MGSTGEVKTNLKKIGQFVQDGPTDTRPSRLQLNVIATELQETGNEWDQTWFFGASEMFLFENNSSLISFTRQKLRPQNHKKEIFQVNLDRKTNS